MYDYLPFLWAIGGSKLVSESGGGDEDKGTESWVEGGIGKGCESCFVIVTTFCCWECWI